MFYIFICYLIRFENIVTFLKLYNLNKLSEQAEAEVVPSSTLVEVEVEVVAEVVVEIEVGLR